MRCLLYELWGVAKSFLSRKNASTRIIAREHFFNAGRVEAQGGVAALVLGAQTHRDAASRCQLALAEAWLLFLFLLLFLLLFLFQGPAPSPLDLSHLGLCGLIVINEVHNADNMKSTKKRALVCIFCANALEQLCRAKTSAPAGYSRRPRRVSTSLTLA